MSGITKSGRVVKKSAKIMEMEKMDDFDESVDKRKRKKCANVKNKFNERKVNYVNSVDKVEGLTFSVAPIGSESSVISDNTGDEGVVMMDAISGSDSNIGAEYYLEENISHQAEARHKLTSIKHSTPTEAQDSLLVCPPDSHDGLKHKKVSKRKDKKSDVRKPSAAFMEWSKSQISNMAEEHPDCDMNLLQDQLVGFWRCISAKEKMRWHRKAQRSGEVVDHEQEDVLFEKASLGPVDIAAHFSLIGDSLVNLGTRLQEHKGKVPLEGNLSILLDSLLSSLSLLMALTNSLPALHGSTHDLHLDTIDKLKGFFEVG